MQKIDAEKLLERFNRGICTEEEIAIIESWYLQLDTNLTGLSEETVETAVNKIGERLPILIRKQQKRKLWARVAVAASLAGVLSIAGYFVLNQPKNKEVLVVRQEHQILPGGNKAMLTLAGGEQIALNTAPNGPLAKQDGVIITKSQDGQIHYRTGPGQSSGSNAYNIMTTPRGGQYQLVLADGTSVWLNAESSIKYPTDFSGKYREVTVTGEAYFEVAKNRMKPFHVLSKDQEIEVLGTHFNVNTYEDEDVVRTTLLEGSVKVTTANHSLIIHPGQQTQVRNSTIDISYADVNDAVAWKQGIFNFEKSDIQTVMRQLSRWYDVDVVYEGTIPKTMITGKVYRNASLSKAMEILTYLDIHYSINERTITIKP